MKYKKCPHCELNYITSDEEICKVCKNLSEQKDTADEAEFEICPICYKGKMGRDELMCKKCFEKRTVKPIDN